MTVDCAQCGAAVDLKEQTAVTACGHCGSSLYVDLGGITLHHALAVEIDEREARRIGRRLLPRTPCQIVYYPFWTWNRNARAMMTPADSHLVEHFEAGPAIAGRTAAFPADAKAQRAAVPPDIPLAAVVAPDTWPTAKPRLVHVPFYELGHAPDTTLVDAIGGTWVANSESEADGDDTVSLPAFALMMTAFALAFLVPGVGAKLALVALLVVVSWFGMVVLSGKGNG